MAMYIRGFLPWIIFAAISGTGLSRAALIALAVGAALIIQDLRRGTAADALILEFSTGAYFAVLSIAAFASSGDWLHHWSGVLSFSWLAATAWITLAVRRPFTLGIARKTTPEQYWTNPVFLRVNVVLSLVWAVAFTLTAAAVAICVASDLGEAAEIVCQVLGFVIPAVFTARYPKIAQARAIAAATAAAETA